MTKEVERIKKFSQLSKNILNIDIKEDNATKNKLIFPLKYIVFLLKYSQKYIEKLA